MPRPHLSEARHAQGLAAYRSSQSIKDLINLAETIDAMHDRPDLSNEEHDEIANALPSVMAGFADGFLEDFRSILHSPTISRRGPSA